MKEKRISKERLTKDLEKILKLPPEVGLKHLYRNYTPEERSKRVNEDIFYYTDKDKDFKKLVTQVTKHLWEQMDNCRNCPNKPGCREDGQAECPDTEVKEE